MPDRYYKSGATVWNSANSWSATSAAGADNAGIPTSVDDVFFTAASSNTCAVTTTIGVCRNITTTGYTGTITLNVDLRVNGNHIIGANTTFAGSAWYTITGTTPATTRTITSNGVLFPNFQLGVAGPPINTLTLNDILNVTNIRQAFANGIVTNGNSVNVNGSMTMEAAGIGWTGTTVYNLTGSGNGDFGMSSTLPSFGNTININKSGGTITFLANVRLNGATFTYNSGTVNTTTNSSLFDLYANNTVTSKNAGTGNEIVFNNVRAGFAGINGTTNLGSDMRVQGNFTVGASNGYSFNNNTIFIAGNVINPNTNITNGGTSILQMSGSNNVSITNTAVTPSSATGYLQRNLTINKSAGSTVTLTGSLVWGAANRNFIVSPGNNLILPSSNTLQMTEGTMIFSGSATLNPGASTLSLTGTGTKILNTSTVNWWNVTNNTQTTLVRLSSSLNISNNLNFTNTAGSAGCGFSGSFNTFVTGSLIATDVQTPSITYTGGGSINMVGTGTIEGSSIMACTINVNTTNPSGYVFGSVARPTFILGNPGTINLISSSIATVFSSSHTLELRVGSTVNTNNTITGANLPGGTEILWGNLTTTQNGTQTTTITQPIIAQGNLTYTNASSTFVINGAKVTVGGNLSCPNLQGTSTIELGQNTNGTWSAGSYQNNIIINKSSPGTASLSGAITWGLAGRTLQRTAGIINPGASTISIPNNTSVTMSGMDFWNLTIPGASTTTQNTLNTIQNNLTLAATGNTAFTGSAGWTCANLICSTINRTITLANSSSGASYRTTTSASLTATSASRITMTSDNATTRSLWTLDNGSQQSLTYINGTRIDSSQGATIWSFGGVLTNTVNWTTGSQPVTQANTFVC